MFYKATVQKYTAALKQYFKRMSYDQRSRKPTIEFYLARAQYIEPRSFTVRIILPINIYILYTSGVEYDFPHTLDDIIIIPLKYLNASQLNYDIMMNHEIMHIYFHHYKCPILKHFCAKYHIIRINRQAMPGEITNPDTLYYTALKMDHRYIFIALIDGDPMYVKKYYVIDNNIIRPCTSAEQFYYDNRLPYSQNEHPEEILATKISNYVFI